MHSEQSSWLDSHQKCNGSAKNSRCSLPSAPLFDTPRFVRNLEHAYQKMWDNYAMGRAAEPIDIAETIACNDSEAHLTIK